MNLKVADKVVVPARLGIYDSSISFFYSQVALKQPTLDKQDSLYQDFLRFQTDFDNLPLDEYMKEGDTYRRRRFNEMLLRDEGECISLTLKPQRGFYQSAAVNGYSGGIDRVYQPLEPSTISNPFLHQLIVDMYLLLPAERRGISRVWDIGIHLYRITAQPHVPGHPVPEGPHRDGHEFTSITLVNRRNVEGGESLFCDHASAVRLRHTLKQPLETALFDDAQGLHDVTPIHCQDPTRDGHRDICGFSLNPVKQ